MSPETSPETSSVDELRRTLDSHSRGLPEVPAGERLRGVHQRARAIRARRRAGAAAAALAVVATLGGVVLVQGAGDGPQPAGTVEVAGHEAPETLTSLDATYTFSAGVTDDDGYVTLDLPASTTPRLVTWAGESAMVVRGSPEGEGLLRPTTPGDFSDFTLVEPGVATELAARSDTGTGEVALAVYELTTPPPGEGVDGYRFPDRYDAQRRIGSVVGEPGMTDLTFTVPSPARGLWIAHLCSATVTGLQVNVAVDGALTEFGECEQEPPGSRLPGSGFVGIGPGALPPAGEDVTVRVWVTETPRGRAEPTEAPVTAERAGDLRLGVGLYEPDPPVGRAGGWDVPEIVEHDGHRWTLAALVQGAGAAELDPVDAEAPYLVSLYTELSDDERGTVRLLLDGRLVGEHSPGSADVATVVVHDAETHSVEALSNREESVALAVYQRVD